MVKTFSLMVVTMSVTAMVVVTRVYEGFILTDHQMRNGKISSSRWNVCQSLL